MAGKKAAKKASKEEKEPEFEIERLVQKRGEGEWFFFSKTQIDAFSHFFNSLKSNKNYKRKSN